MQLTDVNSPPDHRAETRLYPISAHADAGPNSRLADSQQPATLEIAHLVRQLLSQDCRQMYDRIHRAVDRLVLQEVLRHVKGNQVEAAEILGISRNTLRARLRGLGMVIEKRLASVPEVIPPLADSSNYIP